MSLKRNFSVKKKIITTSVYPHWQTWAKFSLVLSYRLQHEEIKILYEKQSNSHHTNVMCHWQTCETLGQGQELHSVILVLSLSHDSVILWHTKSSELERLSTRVIWGPSFLIHIQKCGPWLRQTDRQICPNALQQWQRMETTPVPLQAQFCCNLCSCTALPRELHKSCELVTWVWVCCKVCVKSVNKIKAGYCEKEIIARLNWETDCYN